MRSKQIKTLVLCAVLAALSTVILSLGCFLEVFDMSAAMLATLLIPVAVIEGGKVKGVLTYIVTVLLGFLILPVKTPALIYALSGYYPTLKAVVEKKIKKRILAFFIKAIFFNLSLTVFLLSIRLFVPQFEIFPELELGKVLTYIITFAVGNAIFVLYDILLTRVISFYLFNLRHRLGLDKNR